jgi:hypothetical protein
VTPSTTSSQRRQATGKGQENSSTCEKDEPGENLLRLVPAIRKVRELDATSLVEYGGQSEFRRPQQRADYIRAPVADVAVVVGGLTDR